MKLIALGAVAPVMLAGCWGAPPNETLLNQACTALFVDDARMASNLLSEGADLTIDAFCGCYAAKVSADTAIIDLHKDILNAINVTRDQTGLGVEAAVEHIENAKQDPAEFDTFSMDQLDGVGDYLQSVAQEMGESGSCSAS